MRKPLRPPSIKTNPLLCERSCQQQRMIPEYSDVYHNLAFSVRLVRGLLPIDVRKRAVLPSRRKWPIHCIKGGETMKGIKHTVLAAAALLALGLMTNVAAAQDYSAVNANGTLTLGGYGNFFIPGNLETCPTPPAPYTNSQCVLGDR